MTVDLRVGDCLAVMETLGDASVSAVVCDSPYGLGFMGKDWDSPGGTGDFPMRRTDATNTVNTGAARQGGRQRSCVDFTRRQAREARAYQEWCETWAAECLRVLKPGGHLLAFGGTRTYHRLACGIEDAGFEMRDAVFWLYGQGFPKSRNLDGDWEGWGTALKPACEPITVARKSPVGTVEANVWEYGTGALNIAGCRIGVGHGGEREGEASRERRYTDRGGTDFAPTPGPRGGDVDGRWPANVVLDEATAAMLDEQTGTLTSGDPGERIIGPDRQRNTYGTYGGGIPLTGYGDSGGASRFFYCAKASQAERNAGLEAFDAEPFGWSGGAAAAVARGETYDNGDGGINRTTLRRNTHPTVKPVSLMRWLVRLVTPPGGRILDPFLGSGTTGIAARLEGFPFLGIDQDADYVKLAAARIAFWEQHGDEALQIVATRERADREREAIAVTGQLGLLEGAP